MDNVQLALKIAECLSIQPELLTFQEIDTGETSTLYRVLDRANMEYWYVSHDIHSTLVKMANFANASENEVYDYWLKMY